MYLRPFKPSSSQNHHKGNPLNHHQFKDPVTNRIYLALIEQCHHREVISYRALGEQLGLPWMNDSLGKYLDDINQYTWAEYRVCLSTIVVNNNTGMPGIGFPLWAWRRGIRITARTWYKRHWAQIWRIYGSAEK